jgi:hypothetical protein
MTIPGQPTDINFLSPLGYKFVMNRLPNLEYFVQSFDFPALTLNETPGIQTPFNKLVIAGDHMTFDHFSLTFKIDENMYSYFELYDWMVAVGKPESFDQYAAIAAAGKTSGKGVLSDASLIILNGTMNPNIRIDFFDVLPVRLSNFTFDSKENDVNYITATAEFKYREYTYTRLT